MPWSNGEQVGRGEEGSSTEKSKGQRVKDQAGFGMKYSPFRCHDEAPLCGSDFPDEFLGWGGRGRGAGGGEFGGYRGC